MFLKNGLVPTFSYTLTFEAIFEHEYLKNYKKCLKFSLIFPTIKINCNVGPINRKIYI